MAPSVGPSDMAKKATGNKNNRFTRPPIQETDTTESSEGRCAGGAPLAGNPFSSNNTTQDNTNPSAATTPALTVPGPALIVSSQALTTSVQPPAGSTRTKTGNAIVGIKVEPPRNPNVQNKAGNWQRTRDQGHIRQLEQALRAYHMNQAANGNRGLQSSNGQPPQANPFNQANPANAIGGGFGNNKGFGPAPPGFPANMVQNIGVISQNVNGPGPFENPQPQPNFNMNGPGFWGNQGSRPAMPPTGPPMAPNGNFAPGSVPMQHGAPGPFPMQHNAPIPLPIQNRPPRPFPALPVAPGNVQPAPGIAALLAQTPTATGGVQNSVPYGPLGAQVVDIWGPKVGGGPSQAAFSPETITPQTAIRLNAKTMPPAAKPPRFNALNLPPPVFNLDVAIRGQNVQESTSTTPNTRQAVVRFEGEPIIPDNLAQYEMVLVPAAPAAPTDMVPLSPQLDALRAYNLQIPAAQGVRNQRSKMLNDLTDTPTGLPNIEDALDEDVFPFELCYKSAAGPAQYGVVRIKNIPYTTTRSEIIAVVGRTAKLPPDVHEPVHIIMDKVTSKTQDAYVEFSTKTEAKKAVDRFNELVGKKRQPRLGQRPIELEVATQGDLLHDLFPFAFGVYWDNGMPIIQAPIEKEPWKTFRGFVTEEELTMLVKFVEYPMRSPFARDCPQRPFETYISTIKKYPWYTPECVSVRERHFIATVGFKLVYLLDRHLRTKHDKNDTRLTPQLMKRLVVAIMMCPGFSATQKDNVCFVSKYDTSGLEFNQPRFPEQWAHLHFLVPKPGIPMDVLEWYLAVIREESCRHLVANDWLAGNRALSTQRSVKGEGYTGFLWVELNLPEDKELGKKSIDEMGNHELAVVKQILRRAFPGSPRDLTCS